MSYRGEFFGPTIDSEMFWQACSEDRLLLQQCSGCRHIGYYPRMSCAQCGASSLEPLEACGRGSVYSYTHVYLSFHGPSWNDQLPYTPVLVDLEEGPRITSRLIGVDRDEVAIGDRVEVTFVDVQGRRLPFVRRLERSTDG